MKKKAVLVLAIVLTAVFVLAGCSSQSASGGKKASWRRFMPRISASSIWIMA